MAFRCTRQLADVNGPRRRGGRPRKVDFNTYRNAFAAAASAHATVISGGAATANYGATVAAAAAMTIHYKPVLSTVLRSSVSTVSVIRVAAGYVDVHPGPFYTPTDYAFNEEEVVIPFQGEDCSSLTSITHIDTNSVLVGKAFVGDTIVALDGKAINNVDELHRKLREPSEKVSVKVRHGMWSWCQHRCTTLERIQMDKDTEKVTGRPIDIYFIAMQLSNAPELGNVQLGLYVKYDARERLQVHNVDTSSIAGVHLRPGDIIREVNDKPVSSKTMLKYYILESIVKNKKINFLVECPAGDAYRDCCDMAPDVTDIALKQIERFKKTLNQMPSKSVYTSHRSKNSVSIAPTERTEVEIPADFDPTKLRPCKNAK